jgi:hypothetical protein
LRVGPSAVSVKQSLPPLFYCSHTEQEVGVGTAPVSMEGTDVFGRPTGDRRNAQSMTDLHQGSLIPVKNIEHSVAAVLVAEANAAGKRLECDVPTARVLAVLLARCKQKVKQ